MYVVYVVAAVGLAVCLIFGFVESTYLTHWLTHR